MAGQDGKWQKEGSDQNFDYMFKLLIIGNSSVGKTSFLFRYADDSFTSAFVSTVGIDFKVKTVFRHDKRVKLQIWVSPIIIRTIIPINILMQYRAVQRSDNAIIIHIDIVSSYRTRQARNVTGPSRRHITGAPWVSYSCMTSQMKSPSTAYRTGEFFSFVPYIYTYCLCTSILYTIHHAG